MLSDPRIWLGISLGIGAATALWLIAQVFASELLWSTLGYSMHAVTLLSIFLLTLSGPVAFLFYQYAVVRADLLAGRDVIARWHVDPTLFSAFGKAEISRDLNEKRSALFLILAMLVFVFGAFALFDPKAAFGMFAFGGIAVLAILIAFWLGNRATRKRMHLRSGEVIVGKRGLLVNDVLHVWGSFLSRFSGAVLNQGAHPTLTITYLVLARYGPQQVTVALPFSPLQLNQALQAKQHLPRRGNA